jgi:predicted KAP-like P-loop ATPase
MNNPILKEKYDIHTIIEFNWWWYQKTGGSKIQSSYSDFIDFIKEKENGKGNTSKSS